MGVIQIASGFLRALEPSTIWWTQSTAVFNILTLPLKAFKISSTYNKALLKTINMNNDRH